MPSEWPWAPGCLLGASWLPLVPPSSKMAPGCRRRASTTQSNFFDFLVLENRCQNDCKISSKIDSKWLHEDVKYDKKLQSGSEKIPSRKHAHKIHESQENACLESLIFMSTLVRNRSFHFSRYVQISSKIAPRGSRNGGQQVFLSPKTWQERGLKNIQKTIT